MACFELCVSSVLMENEDIWNFHGSLTSNNGSLWYAIVSNIADFYHNALFCVL